MANKLNSMNKLKNIQEVETTGLSWVKSFVSLALKSTISVTNEIAIKVALMDKDTRVKFFGITLGTTVVVAIGYPITSTVLQEELYGANISTKVAIVPALLMFLKEYLSTENNSASIGERHSNYGKPKIDLVEYGEDLTEKPQEKVSVVKLTKETKVSKVQVEEPEVVSEITKILEPLEEIQLPLSSTSEVEFLPLEDFPPLTGFISTEEPPMPEQVAIVTPPLPTQLSVEDRIVIAQELGLLDNEQAEELSISVPESIVEENQPKPLTTRKRNRFEDI